MSDPVLPAERPNPANGVDSYKIQNVSGPLDQAAVVRPHPDLPLPLHVRHPYGEEYSEYLPDTCSHDKPQWTCKLCALLGIKHLVEAAEQSHLDLPDQVQALLLKLADECETHNVEMGHHTDPALIHGARQIAAASVRGDRLRALVAELRQEAAESETLVGTGKRAAADRIAALLADPAERPAQP